MYYFEVYVRINTVTKKYYIGSTPIYYGMAFRHQADIYESSYPGRARYDSPICQAYREDGPHKFEHVRLARAATLLDIRALEQLYIDKFKSMYWENGYNVNRAASEERVRAFKYRESINAVKVEYLVPL